MGAPADVPSGADTSWGHVDFRSHAQIRQHPRFREAEHALIDGLASLYGDDPRLVRNLTEFVPAVVFMVIVCLDAAYEAGQSETFVTLARLRSTLKAMGITHERRIADIVKSLELDGFLTRDVLPNNRRTHLLRPTEKMLATDRDWLAVFHAPLAILYPADRAFQAAMARDPTYQQAYRRVSLSTLSFADKITRENPVISFFLGFNAGIRVLVVLAAAVRDKTPLRTEPGFYTAAARRAGVSRTHVGNVIRQAADQDLVALSQPAGLFVEMKPVLAGALSQWISDSLSGVDLVARLALAQIDTPPPDAV